MQNGSAYLGCVLGLALKLGSSLDVQSPLWASKHPRKSAIINKPFQPVEANANNFLCSAKRPDEESSNAVGRDISFDERYKGKMNEVVTVLYKDIPLFYSANVAPELIPKVLGFKPFRQWIENMERSMNAHSGDMVLHSILLQSVDMFGSQKVGFVKINADVTLYGKKLPGICFLRGNGVGILVSLYCSDSNEEYTILVDQPRIPLGESNNLEIPAGMLDGSGHFAGVAAQELQEECGLLVKEKDLIDLTDLAYGSRHPGVCTSGGACDEYLRLMYCRFDVTLEEINAMQGTLGGLRDHGEVITLRIIKFDDIWKECCDSKALCALLLLQQLRKEGKICDQPCVNQQLM